MQVRLNGEPRELPDGTTVAGLLERLGLDRDGIAVAVDRDVVPRGRHAEVVLRDGADVEVIRAVGGG
jgi:sulfur carrier protein